MYSTDGTDLKSSNVCDSISPRKVSRWRGIQRRLAKKVICQDCFVKPPRLVGGIDVAYQRQRAYAAAAVIDYDTLEVVGSATVESTIENPYIPSFLAFRELKPMVNTVKRLEVVPDIFLVDAQGIAHPERCGCASHLGVVLDIPTIGVAKSLLIGEVSNPDNRQTRYLRERGEIIGASIVSGASCKPIFVSIGHKISLDSAIEIVRRTARGNRLPEPLRLAHSLANMARARDSQ